MNAFTEFIRRLRALALTPAFLLLAVLLLPTVAPAADLATVQLNRALGRDVGRYATTDGAIALRIKFIGTVATGSARVDIEADGNLEFYADDGTADTNVSTDGVIDVSGAAEDTLGEVLDIINATDDWRAIPVDYLPSMSINNILTSSTSLQAGSDISEEAGHAYYYNTADIDTIALSIGPEYTVDEQLSVSNDDLLNRRSKPAGNPLGYTWQNELIYATATATYTSGAPDLQVYAVLPNATTGKWATGTEIKLYQDVGAATTVAKPIATLPKQAPIKGPPGSMLVVLYRDTTTPDVTAANIQVHGKSYRWTQ